MIDPDPAEQPGKLPEEMIEESGSTPQELGITGTAEDHDISVDFGPAIDAITAKALKPADDKEAAGKEPATTEEPAKQEPAKEEKPESTPAEQAKSAEGETKIEPDKKETVVSDRDSDLKALDTKLDPHTKPKTRKIIDGIKAEAIKARDRAETAEKAAKEASDRAAELEKRASTTEPPHELVKERDAYREQLRQLAIERDPGIISKYDSKIDANTNLVLDTLKKAGLPETSINALKKSGVTLGNVKSYIDMLETGKGADGKQYTPDPESAEQLRESLRENGRLSKAKEAEIADWKTNWEARQKTQQADQEKNFKEANERQQREFVSHVNKFEFLKPPPEPTDSDTPAIKKEKEAARVAFNAKVNTFSEIIKKETADPLTQLITAKVGLMYRELVVPELQARLAKSDARVKELEAQVGSFKRAGAVSKTVSPTAQPSRPKDDDEDDTNADDPFGGIVDKMTRKATQSKE